MRLGYCPQCNKQIGSRTANGVFRYGNKAAQVAMEYGYPDRVATTLVHVAVCKECVESPDKDAIEAGIKTDKPFLEFITAFPTAVLKSVKKEVVV